jgi:hypothetical protein
MTLTAVANPIVITQYQVLLDDIEQARKEAVPSFEYETKEGDKAARSYIFQLRKLRARVESARKEAKAYALAYGKRVDEQAKDLSSQVDELIQPHQEQIEAIAYREAERVAAHQKVLDSVVRLGEIQFGVDSREIAGRLDVLDQFKFDGLEEFADRVAAAMVTSRQKLRQALQQAEQKEEQERELQRLRKEQQEREQRERQQELERKAQERADELAAKAAADAIAAAEARAAAAEAKAAQAEAAASRPPAVAAVPAVAAKAEPPAEMEHGTFVVELPTPPAKEALAINVLEVSMLGMNRRQVAEAIVTGRLHPGLQVRINWELLK